MLPILLPVLLLLLLFSSSLSLLVSSPGAPADNVCPAVGWSANPSGLRGLFTSSVVPSLCLCFFVLLITAKEALQYPTLTVDFPFLLYVASIFASDTVF